MVKLSKFISDLDEYIITPQDVWSCNAPKDLLKLDWNESPCDFDYYQKEAQKIVNLPGVLSWYPDCLALELNNELSNYLDLDGHLILTFPGSDVGLESICRAYLEPDENVVVVSPTYENFYVYVIQNGANLHKCQLDPPFSLSYEYLSSKIKSIGSVKIVYITRPNNPCGYLVDLELIEDIAKKFPDTLFIIDEAYIEFTDEKSCVILIKN